MLLSEITSKRQLEAVARHQIDLSLFNSKKELTKYFAKVNRKTYYEKNKEMFQKYYQDNAERLNTLQRERRREIQKILKGLKNNPPLPSVSPIQCQICSVPVCLP